MSLDLDLERSRAVLLGVSFFPRDPERLPGLPAVRANLADLKRLLADPAVMGLDLRHIVVVDDRSTTEMLSKLAQVANDAEDTLIVYYAGHGLIGGTNLYLTGTDSSEQTIEFDGMPFDRLRRALNNSPARKKVLILDCCYSGRATELMGGTASAMLQANIEDIGGAYVLASSGATEASAAPEGQRHTAFTGELIRIMEEGIQGAPPTLKLRELYRELLLRLRRNANLPEPQQTASNNVGDLDLIHNRARPLAEEPARAEQQPAVSSAPPRDTAELARLAEQIGRQSALIEALQQRLEERDAATAARLAHSRAAERLAAEKAALGHRADEGLTADRDSYHGMLRRQEERIAQLEAALAERARAESDGTPQPETAGQLRSAWREAQAALMPVGWTWLPTYVPPTGRPLSGGARSVIVASVLVLQLFLIGTADELFLPEEWLGFALLFGGLFFWMWWALRQRHGKTNPAFCRVMLPLFIGPEILLAFAAVLEL